MNAGFFKLVASWRSLLILIVLLALGLGLFFFPWDSFRGPINRYVSEQLGRQFEITDRLSVNLGLTTTVRADGLILAGGFVRHPMQWGVRLARRWGGRVSLTWLTRALFWYAKFARIRHRRAQETLASVDEFIARRTELDRDAAVHRLDLIVQNDLRAIAQKTTVPVFTVTGFWDPVVPWAPTFRWLKRQCSGFRALRVIGRADHNVLGTAPREAAEQVLAWMASAGGKEK